MPKCAYADYVYSNGSLLGHVACNLPFSGGVCKYRFRETKCPHFKPG